MLDVLSTLCLAARLVLTCSADLRLVCGVDSPGCVLLLNKLCNVRHGSSGKQRYQERSYLNDGGNNYQETVFFALAQQLRKSLMSKQLFLLGVF